MGESELITYPEVPEIPDDMADAWAVVTGRCGSQKILDGLRHYMNGSSWREAARYVGLQSPTSMYDVATRTGLLRACTRTDKIVQTQREIALETGRLILKRVREDDLSDTGVRDLSVVAGIALDKTLAAEKNAGASQGAFSGVFGDALTTLIEAGGGSVSFSFDVQPNASPVDEAVTVEMVGEDEIVTEERTTPKHAQ